MGRGAAVDLSVIAALTPGLSGADLDCIVNEAAIRAVRRISNWLRIGSDPSDIISHVTPEDFELSLKSFYETRKPMKGGVVGDIIDNVFRK